MHGHELNHVNKSKYLGVTITQDLKWDKHVNNVVSSATRSLNFLRRNLKVRNSNFKQLAYKSLVRPLMEYGSTVWDPYTSNLTNKIEMVQRRAARFVLNLYERTSSVGMMLEALKWQTLEERRKIARLAMFYKIHHGLVAVDMPFVSKNLSAPSRTENSLAYRYPSSSRKYHQMSFFPRTVIQWNSLTQSIVLAPNPLKFKESLSSNYSPIPPH